VEAARTPRGGIQALIGPDLRERAGVRYAELGARRVLNRCDTPRMPDCWTINPYRGCSFGCRYCYARYTHEFLGFEDPLAFERRIFIKLGAPEVLEHEATQQRLAARPIAIGTATDPYQPAEARYRLTRGILEVLARYHGLELSITTKSALIVRDIDVLRRLAERSRLRVHVSLITTDRALARRLDPGAPSPERRLRTVSALADAGVPTGLNAMPILPAINDDEAALRALLTAAREAGAGWVTAAPLWLASASRRRFFDFLRTRMPDRLPLYRSLFARGVSADPEWRDRVRERVAALRAEVGLPPGPPRASRAAPAQLALPGLEAAG
jgi:DNA repair photolyase